MERTIHTTRTIAALSFLAASVATFYYIWAFGEQIGTGDNLTGSMTSINLSLGITVFFGLLIMLVFSWQRATVDRSVQVERGTDDFPFSDKQKDGISPDSEVQSMTDKHKEAVIIETNKLMAKAVLPDEFGQILIEKLSELIEIGQGCFYKVNGTKLKLVATYAFVDNNQAEAEYEDAEGFMAHAIKSEKPLILSEIPEGYITIESGLGTISAQNLIVYPLVHKEKVIALVELAAFKKFKNREIQLLDELSIPAIKGIVNYSRADSNAKKPSKNVETVENTAAQAN